MKELVVDYGILYNRLALLDQGQLIELYIDQPMDQSLVGNIYLGKVVNIVKGMSACFIDIGLDKNAYMPLNQDIKSGMELFVQVKRDPVGNKGATVTTDLSVSGQYVVLLPNSNHKMVSKRIHDKGRIEALLSIVKSYDFGWVIRTDAKDAADDILKAECESLIERWTEIARQKNRILKDRLVYVDYSFEDLIRKEYLPQVDKMILNKKINFDFQSIEYYDDAYPIFETYKVKEQIKKSLNREVKLHQGSFITIDETEALTAIDVNSGQYVGSKNKEETFLQVNLAAGREIARQLRLRNISGVVIVDFINMATKQSESILIEALKKQFKSDKCQPKIHGITALGLMEITRKKNRKSLKSQLLHPCDVCNGSGYFISDDMHLQSFIDKASLLKEHQKQEQIHISTGQGMYDLLHKSFKDTSYIGWISNALGLLINLELDDGYEDFFIK